MSTANEAAWLNEPHAALIVATADAYTPGPGEVVVENEAIAFNPIEAKIQKYAVFPIPYPSILGNSFAGTITKTGPSVSAFKPGDRVVASRPGKSFTDPRFGAYQKYPLASTTTIAKLPPTVSSQDAAATVTNLSTAVAALSVYLGLDRPDLANPAPKNGKKVLVYGGSSSVGGFAVQYAADAGYDVITTSSPHNLPHVSTLGAAQVIDHTLPAADQLQLFASHAPYAAVFDAIGTPSVTNLLYGLLARIGGGVYYSTLPLIGGEDAAPEGVERRFESFGVVLEKDGNEGIGRWFWEGYLVGGLETGRVKSTRGEVVEGGLGGVQAALDRLIVGVSGRKLILDPRV